MEKKENLTFSELMQIYNHIGEEERHFNSLELEYRKLASQWLLVSLGAIGFVLSKQEIPINSWVLVIAISIAASCGIFVLWMLDIKVYHELLHSAFKEGVMLEKEFNTLLPQIRNNMKDAFETGDIINKVILYYYFSIFILIIIANIGLWMYNPEVIILNLAINLTSGIVLGFIYRLMRNKSVRNFQSEK